MKIGWIGTGIMGSSMAGHLQGGGHEVYVFNRTRQKARSILERGGKWCESPADMAGRAEIIFTMVGTPADVEEVYLGTQGIFSVKRACRIAVDMTTSQPSLARKIFTAAAEKGISTLDAPVSGGDVGARNATLAIMTGGEKRTYDEVVPLFRLMGRDIAYLGEAGAGQHTKMCNQILVAGNMIGACEALLYASRIGLDERAVIEIIGKGAAASWAVNNYGPRILQGDFNPGFMVNHFVKDMEIALREAASAGLALPGLALVHQLYVALQAQRQGACGVQALIRVLRSLSGMDASRKAAI
ncbi:MAG TPA: NAD(P)-dependent oxidoreductase, partial [Syntrophales bacterium]|nr:NAD(P)-dependent oxidoreductase [Syntrophales bacterium]